MNPPREIPRPAINTECHETGCSQLRRVLVGKRAKEVDFCAHPYKPMRTRRDKACSSFTTQPAWASERYVEAAV